MSSSRLTRRTLLRSGAHTSLLLAAAGAGIARAEDQGAAIPALTAKQQRALTPAEVIERAQAGNRRFLAGERQPLDHLADQRALADGQYPAAVVLSCIDSRAPAEIIFDVGIGDLFNARVAGNFVNRDIAGSLEYACAVAGAKLVLVLGHTVCGAIKGALDGVKLGNLTGMLENLMPAVESVKDVPGPRSSKNRALVAPWRKPTCAGLWRRSAARARCSATWKRPAASASPAPCTTWRPAAPGSPSEPARPSRRFDATATFPETPWARAGSSAG
jgi:carbonic anhydrase